MKVSTVSLHSNSNFDNHQVGKIRVGLSAHFHNKPAGELTPADRKAKGFSFVPSTVTPAQLVEHIQSGKAWTVANLDKAHRHTKNFISGQVLGLDIDNGVSVEAALKNNFVKTYAALVHPSPSSTPDDPRTRIVFILSEPVEGVQRFTALVSGLIHHLNALNPDASCSDAVRFFYGSDLPGAYVNLDAILPLCIAGELTVYEALDIEQKRTIRPIRQRESNQIISTGDDLLLAYVEKIKSFLPAEALAGQHVNCLNPHHTDNNASFRIDKTVVKHSYGLTETPFCSCNIHKDPTPWLTMGRNWFGLSIQDFAAQRRAAIRPGAKKSGLDMSSPENSDRSELDDFDMSESKTSDMSEVSRFEARIPGDVVGHTRYMNQLEIPVGDLLLISDTGTGKTTFVSEEASEGSFLALGHRVSLMASLSEATNAENYKGLTAVQMRQVSRLAVCVDSVWKLISDGSVAAYETVFIDETEQVLTHIATSSTLRDKRETVYNALKAVVRKAGRVIAADAYASEITLNWLAEVRGTKPTVVVNEFARSRGKLTDHAHKNSAVAKAFNLTDENAGPVVVATSSARLARDLYRAAAKRYGDQAVITIHQKSTTDDKVKAFLKNPNQQIKQYRLVIYSPTVGSGVDIQTPVRAVVGIFLAEPLAATDAHQMLNRCRNAQETHIFVEQQEGHRETDSAVIYREAFQEAQKTGLVANFDQYGQLVATDDQKSLLKLYALTTAQHRASQNELKVDFMRLVKGYSSCTTDESDNSDMSELLKQARSEINEIDRAKTLAAAPVDRASYDAAIEDGSLTEDQRYGYLRWQIERVTGKEITPALYDSFHTAQQRSALRLLTDYLHADEDQLKERDRKQAATGIHERRHYTRKIRLFRAVIQAVFGAAGLNTTEEILAADLAFRMDTVLLAAGDDLRRLFGRRSDKSESPIAVLRWLLNRFGLKLVSRQRGKGDNRVRVYWLDQDTSTTMQALAASCWQRQLQDAQTGALFEGTQNREKTNSRIPVLSTLRSTSSSQQMRITPIGGATLSRWSEIEF